MGVKTVELKLDYMQGPIWFTDAGTGGPLTGIDIVDNDKIVIDLNKNIQDLYNSLYEFDSHNEACWFDTEKAKTKKPQLSALINKLIDRLSIINDGSYVVKNDIVMEF